MLLVEEFWAELEKVLLSHGIVPERHVNLVHDLSYAGLKYAEKFCLDVHAQMRKDKLPW